MAHQTKINEQNGSPQTASKGLARDVGEFAQDVFTLAELQGQLFVADVRECSQQMIVPALLLSGGAALGVSCFPFALAALALGLIQIFELSSAAGFLIAVVVGAVLSALMCLISVFLIRKRVVVLRRSQQELVRNLRWIKKVLERNRTKRGSSNDNSWRTVS